MLEQETRNYQKTVGVGIICDTAVNIERFKELLNNVVKSPLNPKVSVINYNKSISDPGFLNKTLNLERFNVEFVDLPKDRMNSGWSREIARKSLKTDIFVSLGGNIYFDDKDMLEKLVKPIIKGSSTISYARQVATKGANEIAVFSKLFNYPEDSNMRAIEDSDRYGVYTIFCSNKCAAWDNSMLDNISGFPWVLHGEDTIVTAKLLKKGYKIAYVSEAVVEYSRNYNFKEEFSKHFDTGMYRKRWCKILEVGEKDEGRGFKYAREMFKFLWKRNKKLIPNAFLQLGMGWLGYKLGWYGLSILPDIVKSKISSINYFWISKEFKDGLWNEPIDSEKLLYSSNDIKDLFKEGSY